MARPAPFFKGASAARRAGRAGFTLVELMVAMTGGLFLSVAVFALSRDASRFYQQETRIANATLSGVSGFERLFNDIARAGHLVTPNIDFDPRVCNRPQASWPDRIENLRALVIDTANPQTDATEVGKAGLKPMVIDIAGALDVTEELTIAEVGPGVGANAISIRLDTPAAARLGLVNDAAPASVQANRARLLALLMPDGNARAVRITQLDGMEQYALVASVQPNLQITLAAEPPLQFRSDAPGAVQCGIRGFNTGGSLSVVNFVRYELKSMVTDVNYSELFKASRVDGGLPYESGRVELTRVELSPAGAAIESTREIVSEYAVDLQFSLIRATSALDGTLIAAVAANVDSEYSATQLLRGVNARLSVRSREADRSADVSGMGGTSGLYRIPLAAGGAAATPYARVRTFQSHISLRNLEGANW
jgi:prepilin-type N-terminal cleavage/methylation domain-containing protein